MTSVPHRPSFFKKDRVRVTSGKFKGRTGAVVFLDRGRKQVTVRLDDGWYEWIPTAHLERIPA